MTADLVPPPARQQLPSRWAAVTVADLLHSGVIRAHKDGNHGSNYPRAAEFGDNGVPFLTAKLLDDGHIDIDSAPRLPDERADGLRIGFVQPGDVLLSHNATIGRVAVVPMYTGRLLIGTSLTYFRLDKTRLIPNYLAAFFRGAYFQNQLKALMSHSTRNQVPITAQRHLQIMVPPVKEQLAITSILDAFNDRINLLRQTNATLEAIAQALFKSWFVDFDPVHAKAEGREPEAMDAATAALFPSEFADSELGPIPKGWASSAVYDLAQFINGAAYKAFDPNREKRGLPIIKIAELKAGITEQTAYSDVEMPDKYRIDTGDILFSWSGNPDTSIDTFVWSSGSAWLNQHIFRVVPSSTGERSFMLLALKYLRPTFAEIARNKQTTGLGHVTVSDLKRLRIAKPDEAVLQRWSLLVDLLVERSFAAQQQAQILAELRDALLPRLITGKLRLPEATEAATEECTA